MVHQRWQKAALLGSVWASLEIVLGSFLHNMKFPLTGTLLSSMGIAVLIAGHSLWKEKGIVWRAGIICAVLKSVSPSSIILGPMIGIAAEAFIVEAAIRSFGGNAFGYIVGGAFACTTPFIQKMISYLFTYGMDIALLFGKLVEMAAKSLQISTLGPLEVLAAVIVLNLLLGGAAAVIGMNVGKSALLTSGVDLNNKTLLPPRSEFLQETVNQFSALLLTLHLLVLVFGLIYQSIYFLAYVPFCLYHYQHVRKKFKRWFFWFEIGFVSIIAGLVLGELTLADRTAGIITGLQMFFRAIFVVSLFTAITVELRNPVIINFLLKKRLKNFSLAVNIAFGALPSVIDSLQQEKSFFRHPVDSLSRILVYANEVQLRQIQKSIVYILSGEKGSGKTTLLKDLIPELTSMKISAGGILQIGLWMKDVRYGFDILNINTGKVIPLCRTDAHDTGISTGPFTFFPEAIHFGNDALSMSTIGSNDIVIIDEIGPLELTGSGWASSVNTILQNYRGTLIIVIRSSLVDEVLKTFNIIPSTIWKSDNISIDTIMSLFTKIKGT